MWRYALKEWRHPDSGLTHEDWWAGVLAEGREAELPDLAVGAVIGLSGRTVRRHAVKRWVPDRSATSKPSG